MRHLWQRIFAYSLALIFLSQAAVLLLHRRSINYEEAQRFSSESTLSFAAALDGQDMEFATAMTRLFNRKYNRVWLENADGEVVAGVRPFPERLEAPADESRTGAVAVWRAPNDALRLITSAPVVLTSGKAFLFMTFGPPRGPGMWTMFFQGVLALSCLGGGLALWMAWRVSRPLRTLRNEVMEIAGGDLARRVNVAGKDEISDVAVAVNHMADNLAKHIRSMKELVANISHEMRSPLARMQVSLALLEEDLTREGAHSGQTASRFALLREELDHMNSLIGTTLLSSKLDLNEPPALVDAVAFSELCAEMGRRYAPVFSRQGLTFSQEVASGALIRGDESLLINLVSNLLDNAAKYASAPGDVALRLTIENGKAALVVENVHAPLAPEILDHIFEPFYRAGKATGNGVGLGLSLVGKIAAMHGGEAKAANTPTGVRFTVAVPLVGNVP